MNTTTSHPLVCVDPQGTADNVSCVLSFLAEAVSRTSERDPIDDNAARGLFLLLHACASALRPDPATENTA